MRGSILLAPVLVGLVSALPHKKNQTDAAALTNPIAALKGTIEELGGFFMVHNKAGAIRIKDPLAAIKQSFSKYGFDAPPEVDSKMADIGDGGDDDDDDDNNSASPTTSVGLVVPTNAPKTVQKLSGQTGEVAANGNGNGDIEYLSPVTIGGQKLMMDFDTGSSDFWVFSNTLPANSTAGHTLYDPSKSKTWSQMSGSTFAVNYGDHSSVSGSTVGTDVVEIGGATITQTIELADHLTNNFVADTASNGLVGLGFGNLNTVKPNKQKTFIESIQNSLAQPVFTANLKHNSPGMYTFGKIDKTQYKNDLVWTDAMNVNGHWGFASPSFAVGDTKTMTANPSNHYAIADTGTSLLLMDDLVVNDYYGQVYGAHYSSDSAGWIYPCSSSLPDLHIAVGPNYSNTVPGSVMTFVTVSNGNCYGALQSNGNSTLQILGDILFKAQFVAFDIGNMKIGFADHA